MGVPGEESCRRSAELGEQRGEFDPASSAGLAEERFDTLARVLKPE
jgi:hypothetical protein